AGVLALVALAVGRYSRRPALVHCLWVLVLIKLITPPLVSLPVPLLGPAPTPRIEFPTTPVVAGSRPVAQLSEPAATAVDMEPMPFMRIAELAVEVEKKIPPAVALRRDAVV